MMQAMDNNVRRLVASADHVLLNELILKIQHSFSGADIGSETWREWDDLGRLISYESGLSLYKRQPIPIEKYRQEFLRIASKDASAIGPIVFSDERVKEGIGEAQNTTHRRNVLPRTAFGSGRTGDLDPSKPIQSTEKSTIVFEADKPGEEKEDDDDLDSDEELIIIESDDQEEKDKTELDHETWATSISTSISGLVADSPAPEPVKTKPARAQRTETIPYVSTRERLQKNTNGTARLPDSVLSKSQAKQTSFDPPPATRRSIESSELKKLVIKSSRPEVWTSKDVVRCDVYIHPLHLERWMAFGFVPAIDPASRGALEAFIMRISSAPDVERGEVARNFIRDYSFFAFHDPEDARKDPDDRVSLPLSKNTDMLAKMLDLVSKLGSGYEDVRAFLLKQIKDPWEAFANDSHSVEYGRTVGVVHYVRQAMVRLLDVWTGPTADQPGSLKAEVSAVFLLLDALAIDPADAAIEMYNAAELMLPKEWYLFASEPKQSSSIISRISEYFSGSYVDPETMELPKFAVNDLEQARRNRATFVLAMITDTANKVANDTEESIVIQRIVDEAQSTVEQVFNARQKVPSSISNAEYKEAITFLKRGTNKLKSSLMHELTNKKWMKN